MSSSSLDLTPEPDLHPIYPSSAQISLLLSPHSSGLNPDQRRELVRHAVTRACVFAELSVLQYLLSDAQALPFIDLAICDEDGLGLVSLTIHGFGADSDRDVEREECVRLLIAQGADMSPDNAGWTPLHHAALLSPPTLISHLMTHGCSPFDVTRRNLTPLDIVTAHSVLPGREDVALLLEETMRSQGWTGGRVEQNRRVLDERRRRRGKRRDIRNDVGQVLDVQSRWWGSGSDEEQSDSDEEPFNEMQATVYTPPADYGSMLVFSPAMLPQIFDSLISRFHPAFRDATPANTLYLLARFACLTCDHTWLEDLIIGATDAIEETFFNRSEDVTCLVFWLYNSTLWLHLLQCDNSINEACEILGSFELIEEVINSVFVFIIRYAERRIDQLLDSALLDHSTTDLQPVQFESEWSFLRPFSNKRKNAASNGFRVPLSSPPGSITGIPSSPSKGGFSSLRQSSSRARASSTTSPLQSLFSDPPPSSSSPWADLLSFLTALHTLLTLSDVNPAFIAQLWSQVMYWTACEMFNRVLTRKKYLCRSRAVQITVNLNGLDEWITEMGLPKGISAHFAPVRDLLSWLQCLSSITEFPNLVATIQRMKFINPLQMRRAVRDYKYEVNEGRMNEECVQYLTQLQKDWERHRVKLGVEALRKEMSERERDRDSSVSSLATDSPPDPVVPFRTEETPDRNIDVLFDGDQDTWEPPRPPQVLGELLDSRYMLPLLFPSDPRMLAALPGKLEIPEERKFTPSPTSADLRNAEQHSKRRSINWRCRNSRLREVEMNALKAIDGHSSTSRWNRFLSEEDEEESHASPEEDSHLHVDIHTTPLTRKPSARGKGRASLGDDQTTPIEWATGKSEAL